MSLNFSTSTLKKIENAVFTTETQKLIEETQQEMNEEEKRLSNSITTLYPNIMNFCVSLNQIKDSLETLTELNNRSNEYLQETCNKIKNNVQEIDNLNSIERNLNQFTNFVNDISSFRDEIDQISETEDTFRIILGLHKLEKILLKMKHFSFYHKLNSEFSAIKSYLVKNIKKQAEEWIDQNNSAFERYGSNFLKKIKEDKSLLFDFRYLFFEETQMQKVYDMLYLYSAIKKSSELINKMNFLREVAYQQIINSCQTTESILHITIGFFIVEFYLLDINASFDLKETYVTMLQEIIQENEFIQSNVFEKKNFLITIENIFSLLSFDKTEIKNEILQLAFQYFNEEKEDIQEFTDIDPHIRNMEKMVEDIDDLDIKTLFYKNVDDILLKYFSLDENYLSFLVQIQKKYEKFSFRAVSKYKKESNVSMNKLNENFWNKFEKIIDEQNFDKFNDLLQDEFNEIKNIDMNKIKKTAILLEIKQKCVAKLEQKEKINPEQRMNYNSKRALFVKMIDNIIDEL